MTTSRRAIQRVGKDAFPVYVVGFVEDHAIVLPASDDATYSRGGGYRYEKVRLEEVSDHDGIADSDWRGLCLRQRYSSDTVYRKWFEGEWLKTEDAERMLNATQLERRRFKVG